MRRRNTNWLFPLVLLVTLGAPAGVPARSLAQAEPGCRIFVETGHGVCGRFLEYWNTSGGLAQQGYPISDELSEKSDTDGKVYKVQYFERAVFELHPENPRPYDVLLSLLGVFEYARRYGSAGAADQHVSTDHPIKFDTTGHSVGGKFLQYWIAHGGLPQEGYPISEEFQEKSALDGKTYTVQYFQRAVFELHPEKLPPYDVLLSQLGKFQYDRRNAATATAVPAPTVVPTPTQAGPPVKVGVGDTVRRNGMAFTVTRVDLSLKGVAVIFVLTDESAGQVSFVLANSDQHLFGASTEYGKVEPDRRLPLTLNNGQSYSGATGFHRDQNRQEKALTYEIDNLPGIGTVRVDIPVD